jgi:hypothetical protein
MAAAAQYRHQEIAARPRGWRVRSKRAGEHVLRIGFPPGARRRGAGKVLEILHPKKNPACEEGSCDVARKNPEELIIFGNPCKANRTPRGAKRRRRNAGTQGHKPGCKCFACKHGRGENPKRATPRRRRTKRAKAPGGVRAIGARREKRRRFARKKNITDAEQAVQLFETFHGRDPKEIVEKHVSAAVRKDYTALGKLIAVGTDDCGLSDAQLTNKWDQCPRIEFADDHVTLAASPDGQQLYAIGGNQNLNGCLEKFEGIDANKDFVDLGDVAFVVYEARKIHSNFEPVEWVHKFGGRDSVRPRWMYDKLRRQIFFIGGQYTIDTKQSVSPGIEG